MAAVRSSRAQWSTSPDARSAARVRTGGSPGAIGAFRIHIERSQPAPRAPERGIPMSTHTPVCDLLGIEHPIVEAPLAADPRLPAAVSNAGGLGSLGLSWADDAGEVVRETAALTDRPFGGNFVLNSDQHRRVDQALSAGCGSCRSSLAIPRATSTRCTTPEGLFCIRSAAPRKRGAQSDAEWTSSSRRAGRPVGTCGVAWRRSHWCRR